MLRPPISDSHEWHDEIPTSGTRPSCVGGGGAKCDVVWEWEEEEAEEGGGGEDEVVVVWFVWWELRWWWCAVVWCVWAGEEEEAGEDGGMGRGGVVGWTGWSGVGVEERGWVEVGGGGRWWGLLEMLALKDVVAQKGGSNDEVLDASVAAECGETAALVAERGAEARRTGARA